MSLYILKQGQLDSIQDSGRNGYQNLGINPGGVMDPIAGQVANMLAGNDLNEALMELHYPASSILFKEDVLIALSGADFGAMINDQPIPLHTPIIIKKISLLQFSGYRNGARCYLAIHGGFDIPKWLNSYSTNFKAKAGGFYGRSINKDDELKLKKNQDYHFNFNGKDHAVLPWRADVSSFYTPAPVIRVCEGKEFNLLTHSSKELLISSAFTITQQSDRMGFRMNGDSLQLRKSEQLVSTAVTKGTVQLFPGGQMIILMADHQTTGGYPKIAHVISADIPKLAQLMPGALIQFQMISQADAEDLFFQQHQHLQVLQKGCTFHLTEFFNHHGMH